MKKKPSPLVDAVPEQGETKVVAAVATGSLPAQSVNNLLTMWDFLAGHWKETADIARRDGREQAETIAQSRADAYQLVCKQLRAEMEAAMKRQPEENIPVRQPGEPKPQSE